MLSDALVAFLGSKSFGEYNELAKAWLQIRIQFYNSVPNRLIHWNSVTESLIYSRVIKLSQVINTEPIEIALIGILNYNFKS